MQDSLILIHEAHNPNWSPDEQEDEFGKHFKPISKEEYLQYLKEQSWNPCWRIEEPPFEFAWKIDASQDTTVILTENHLVFREQNQGFNGNRLTFNLHFPAKSAKQAKTRQLAISGDAKIVALGYDFGTLELLSFTGDSNTSEWFYLEDYPAAITGLHWSRNTQHWSKRNLFILTSVGKIFCLEFSHGLKYEASEIIVNIPSPMRELTFSGLHVQDTHVVVGVAGEKNFSIVIFQQTNKGLKYIETTRDRLAVKKSGIFSGWFEDEEKEIPLIQVRFSTEGSYAACLLDGSLKIWTRDGQKTENVGGVFDFRWWSDYELVISFLDGSFRICECSNVEKSVVKTDDLQNFSFPCRISNLSLKKGKRLFFLLSCDIDYVQCVPQDPTEESPCSPQRSFSLLSIYETTPKERFEQMLDDLKFDQAISLVDEYNFDVDIVRKKQFQSKTITLETINDILHKINDKNWCIDQCRNRLSPDMEILHALYAFGEELSDEKDIIQFQKLQIRLKCFQELQHQECGFSLFRDIRAFDHMLFVAKQGWVEDLTIALTYLGHEVSKGERLYLIFHIPNCVPCNLYKSILPTLEPISMSSPGSEEDIIQKYEDSELLSWYKSRIYKMDAFPSFVDNALWLSEYAISEEISGLEEMTMTLRKLYHLRYTSCLTGVTLKKLQETEILQLVCDLLGQLERKDHILKLIDLLIIFEDNFGVEELCEYFKIIASYRFPEIVDCMENAVIREKLEDDFIRVSLDCAYLTDATVPLNALQELQRLFLEIKREWKDDGLIASRIDEYMSYVNALSILHKYSIKRRIADFTLKEFRMKGKKLLQEVCMQAIKDENLRAGMLIRDLYDLKGLIFHNLNDEAVAEVVLLSGDINLMKHFLRENMKYLEIPKFVKIIINMGKDIISKAYGPDDLVTARECFELVKDVDSKEKSRIIKQKLKLIDALETLAEFNVQIAPDKIQQMNGAQRTTWFQEVVQNSSRLYRNTEAVEEIARLLKISDMGVLNVWCARAAMNNQDWENAKEICLSMSGGSGLKESWDICVETAKQESIPEDIKKRLISQAICSCPISELTTTLRLWEDSTRRGAVEYRYDEALLQGTNEEDTSKLVDMIFDGCRKGKKISEMNVVSQHLATSLCGPEPGPLGEQFDSVVHFLARQSFNENPVIAQAYMAVTGSHEPLHIASDNPFTKYRTSLFNLRFLVARLVAIVDVEVNATEVFDMDVEQIMAVIKKAEKQDGIMKEASELLDLARDQCDSLSGSDHLTQLIMICPDVDAQRLMSEPEYFGEVVDELALSIDESKITIGINLCKKFEQQLDVWSFITSHLEFLVEKQEAKIMKQRVEALKEMLMEDHLEAFSEALKTNLYEKCDGEDLDKIKYLLELQQTCLEKIGNRRSDKAICKDKIRILEMIQNPNISAVSFKRLVDISTCEDEIKRVISKDTLSIFRTLVHRLRNVLKPKVLTREAIYALLLQKIAETESMDTLEELAFDINIFEDIGLEYIMNCVANLERQDSETLEMKMKILEMTLSDKELSEEEQDQIKMEQSFGEVLETISFLPTEARVKLIGILGSSWQSDALYSTISQYILSKNLSEKDIISLVNGFQNEYIGWKEASMKKAVVLYFSEGLKTLGPTESRDKMFKRVVKSSRSIFKGQGSIASQLMKPLVNWTLSETNEDFDTVRLDALNFLDGLERTKPKIKKFLEKTFESRKTLRTHLLCKVKVRSVLPEATLSADDDIVEALLSEGNSLPPAGRLAVLQCILEIDEISSRPTEWINVVDYVVELDCSKLKFKEVCVLCNDITKRAALPIDACDRLFHFISTYSILEGIRIALLSPHGDLHIKACNLLQEKMKKREQWWFFSPNMQDLYDDKILDLLVERDFVHLFYETKLQALLFERLNQEQILSETRRALDEENIMVALTLVQLYAGIPELLHDAQVGKVLLDSKFMNHPFWSGIRESFA